MNLKTQKNKVESMLVNNHVLTGTDAEFTRKLMEGMTGYFFSNLYNPNLRLVSGSEEERIAGNIKSLFDKSDPGLFTRLYNSVKNSLFTQFSKNIENMTKASLAQGFKIEDIEKTLPLVPIVKKQMIASELIDTEVKTLFKDFLSQFGMKFEDVKEDSLSDEQREALRPNEEDRRDTLGIVESIYVDPKDAVRAEVRLLIASLPSEKYIGEMLGFRTDEKLGLPILEDYSKKMNILLNELHSIVPVVKYDASTKTAVKISAIEQMFDKLDNRFKDKSTGKFREGYEWIAKLKYRLAYTDIKGVNRDTSSLKKNEIDLLEAFEKSFSNTRNIPTKIIVKTDGGIFCDKTLDLTYERQIRNRWKNNTKNLAKEFDWKSKEENINRPFVYRDKLGEVRFNTDSKEFAEIAKADKPLTIIQALRKLGFDFTATDEEIRSKYGKDLFENFAQIIQQFKKGNIKTVEDLYGRQVVNSRIKFLEGIELCFTANSNVLSILNVEGREQYSITKSTNLNLFINSLNSVENLTDLVLSNPKLGKVDMNTGEVVLSPSIKHSALLAKDGPLFDNNGVRIKRNSVFEYRYILGIAYQKDNTWVSTSRLDIPRKVIQEVLHLFEGTYISTTESYNDCEIGIHVGHLLDFNAVNSSATKYNTYIMELYGNALKDELATALYESKNKNIKIKNYSDNVINLGHFRDIIQLSTNNETKLLFKEYMSGKITEDAFVANDTIQTLIANHIDEEVRDIKAWWKELGLISIKDGEVFTRMFSNEQVNSNDYATCPVRYKDGKLDEYDLERIIKFYAVNKQLMVYEQHKLLSCSN